MQYQNSLRDPVFLGILFPIYSSKAMLFSSPQIEELKATTIMSLTATFTEL